jgi:hypothetical protein
LALEFRRSRSTVRAAFWTAVAGVSAAPLSATLPSEADAYTLPIPNASVHRWRVALASAPEGYLLKQQTMAPSDTFEGLTPGADLPRGCERRRQCRPERLERHGAADGALSNPEGGK